MPSLNHLHLDSWIYKCFNTSGIWKTSFLRTDFIWFVDRKAKEKSTTARQASTREIISPEKSSWLFRERYLSISIYIDIMMADCPRVYIHIYSPTACRDMILQEHTLFNLQDDVSNSSSTAWKSLAFLCFSLLCSCPEPYPYLSPQTCWKHNFLRAYYLGHEVVEVCDFI